MAAFEVHEDIPGEITNGFSKNFKSKKICEGSNRVAFQAITSDLNQGVVVESKKPKLVNENCNKGKENAKQNCDKIKVDNVFKPPFVDSFTKNSTRNRRIGYKRELVTIGDTELEYEGEIWSYLFAQEKLISKVRPSYMSKQKNINWEMRSVLIDWLVSVAQEYKMNEQTIHLSVNYIDRFLSNIAVVRDKFQLIGATAMAIAGKVEEIYPPDMKEWSFLTGDTYTVRQILKMEQLMLKVLNFELQPPTMLDFIKHLCAKLKFDKKTMLLAMYLSELVLLEGGNYLKEPPSKLAAASVAVARHTLTESQSWNKKLEETVGYTLKQLSPVVIKQHQTFRSSPFKEQQAIQKKYASDKYERVTLLKPRTLVMDDEE